MIPHRFAAFKMLFVNPSLRGAMGHLCHEFNREKTVLEVCVCGHVPSL